jgi:hypothetical protein
MALTLQQMADIAMRWETTMSDAMIVACVQRHHETREPLRIKTRREARGQVRVIQGDDVDWERLMRENSDTRWNHC